MTNPQEKPLFDYEEFDVYKLTVQYIAVADKHIQAIPRGRRPLADQLLRASNSIINNIAEGAGEFVAPEKARFYRMAKRSATECASVFDSCAATALIPKEEVYEVKVMLSRIVAMLIKLIHSVEAR